MFNWFVQGPVFLCGRGEEHMKRHINFWRANPLNFGQSVRNEEMFIVINSQYTIENNGCMPNKIQVIFEHLLCLNIYYVYMNRCLLCSDEQEEVHKPREQDSCFGNSSICWLPKYLGVGWLIVYRSFGKSHATEEQTSENTFFCVGWEEHGFICWSFQLKPLVLVAFSIYKAAITFAVYVHSNDKMVESQSYKRNNVLTCIWILGIWHHPIPWLDTWIQKSISINPISSVETNLCLTLWGSS